MNSITNLKVMLKSKSTIHGELIGWSAIGGSHVSDRLVSPSHQ